MKKLLYLLLFLFLSFFALAEESYYDRQMLTIDFNISNTLQVIKKSNDYSLKKVTVFLSFFPQEDFRQKVLYVNTRPVKNEVDGGYKFQWFNPADDTLSFSVNSRITTHNELSRISKKISFPIRNPDTAYDSYLEETPTIDYSDRQVMNLASELAYGEDDLYAMVHKLAAWVNENIDYNLNTKTADASQPASWVIENREGVCDELTNLFIGLCRALGIPARFVSGISYTNLDIFPDKWSPHGWAEVYFPGSGWVPFDVTYGEFGYIDPTHIKLKDSLDANKSSTRYEWIGYDVDLKTDKLTTSTKVVDAQGRIRPLVNIHADILKDKIGFESYNVVEVELENTHSYYVPVELFLSKTDEIGYLDKNKRFVLLRPFEKKKELFILKLKDKLRNRYIYNFTIRAYTSRNASSTINFFSTDSYRKYTLAEMRQYVNRAKEEAAKTYSREVELNCTADKSTYYVTEKAVINCKLYNTGNVALKDMVICIEDDCQTADIGIGQKRQLIFEKELGRGGTEDVLVTAKNSDVTKSADVEFEVWSRPSVTIDELNYPEHISLDDKFTIEFRVGPNTSSIPKDVQISMLSDSFEKQWSLDDLKQNRKYILNVDEYTLSDMSNRFRILVTYADNMGRKYSSSKEFVIDLSNVGPKQRLIMLLNKINIQLRYDMIIVVIAFFAAGIVVGLIFRVRDRRK